MNQEFLRMQKLAGIKSQPAFDDLVIEALTEYYLYTNYYSKGILKENLNEGVFTKLKNTLVKQFKGIKPTEAVATVLFAKLRNLVNDDKLFDKITDYIKSSKDKNPSKEEIELFLNKLPNVSLKEAKTSAWQKSVLIFMLSLIGFLSATKYNDSKVDTVIDNSKNANVEKAMETTPGLDDDNTANWIPDLGDNFKVPEAAQKALDKASGDGDNIVSTSDDGTEISVSNEKGEYNINDEDAIAQQIADKLASQVPDGEEADEMVIDLEGKISDTPGSDANDNVANDGNKDLAGKRLESAKNLFTKIKDILKVKYKAKFSDPDNQVKIGKETKAKGTKAVGAEGDEKEQTIKFKVKDVKLKKVEKEKTDLPDFDDKTYLRAPRITAPDANKYTLLIAQFLPELISREMYSTFRKNLTLKKDEVLNDKTISDNITRLEKLNTDDANNTAKLLRWAIFIKKNPKALAKEFNRLDPNLKLTYQKNIVNKPGEKGKAISRPGSGLTQTPQSAQRVAETLSSLTEMYSSLLLEVDSNFSTMPGYIGDSEVKAKLGILVPLYVYNWNIGGDIEYVANTYKESFNIFSRNYPVIVQKLKPTSQSPDQNRQPTDNNTGTSSSTDNKSTSSSSTDGTSNSLDKKQDQIKTRPDVTRLDQIISANKPLITVLKRINTQDELASLLTAFFIFRDKEGSSLFPQGKQFRDDPGRVRSALFGLNARLNEAKELSFDVKDFMSRLEKTPGLIMALNKISDIEEFYEFILRVLLPKISPSLLKDKDNLKTAIARAANASKEFAAKGKYTV